MPEHLIAGYHRFRKGYFLENQHMLKALADGQSPTTVVISCCDSRVDPSVIFNSTPGELFVIRNVANLVPRAENDGRPKGTSSALEFAVTTLHVTSIVILGHTRCGGIKALMDRDSSKNQNSFVDSWMAIAAPAKEKVLARDLAGDDAYIACEQETIIQSLTNLMSFPWIAERVNAGTLSLHGWYYDLQSAALMRYDRDTATFVAV